MTHPNPLEQRLRRGFQGLPSPGLRNRVLTTARIERAAARGREESRRDRGTGFWGAAVAAVLLWLTYSRDSTINAPALEPVGLLQSMSDLRAREAFPITKAAVSAHVVATRHELRRALIFH